MNGFEIFQSTPLFVKEAPAAQLRRIGWDFLHAVDGHRSVDSICRELGTTARELEPLIVSFVEKGWIEEEALSYQQYLAQNPTALKSAPKIAPDLTPTPVLDVGPGAIEGTTPSVRLPSEEAPAPTPAPSPEVQPEVKPPSDQVPQIVEEPATPPREVVAPLGAPLLPEIPAELPEIPVTSPAPVVPETEIASPSVPASVSDILAPAATSDVPAPRLKPSFAALPPIKLPPLPTIPAPDVPLISRVEVSSPVLPSLPEPPPIAKAKPQLTAVPAPEISTPEPSARKKNLRLSAVVDFLKSQSPSPETAPLLVYSIFSRLDLDAVDAARIVSIQLDNDPQIISTGALQETVVQTIKNRLNLDLPETVYTDDPATEVVS